MGGNVERHIGDDDRDGAAIEALQPGGICPRRHGEAEMNDINDWPGHPDADPDCECCLGDGLQADGETPCPCIDATPPAAQVTVADCIAALKAMPTRTEALGGQDFKYIQLGEALDTLRALAGDGRRRQMKALIVGGPDRGQVVDVQDDDPRVDRVLMGSHVHNFIVDADVPNPREYVMRELCRAYEYLMKGETHRQHIKKNGKL